MDRAIMIGLRWFVVAATITGAVAGFLNWLVIGAASVTLISVCLEAVSLRRGAVDASRSSTAVR